MVLGSDKEQTVLKGVVNRSEVGLLSLFEHYKSCSVGSNLKSPLYPIWLVCSESHFSTLWAADNNNYKELFYYDGLSGEKKEFNWDFIFHILYRRTTDLVNVKEHVYLFFINEFKSYNPNSCCRPGEPNPPDPGSRC